METARVDIRKLQLLNDRINQCLDALNQVRLTVHGLSHSSLQTGLQAGAPTAGASIGQPPIGMGATDPRLAAQGPGMQGFGAQGYGAGLSHSPFAQPFGQPQFGQQQFGQAQFGQPQFGQQYGAPIGSFPGAAPWMQQGLGHSDYEALYNRPVWADPSIASRVKETFPFVGYALPPIVSLY